MATCTSTPATSEVCVPSAWCIKVMRSSTPSGRSTTDAPAPTKCMTRCVQHIVGAGAIDYLRSHMLRTQAAFIYRDELPQKDLMDAESIPAATRSKIFLLPMGSYATWQSVDMSTKPPVV